MNQTEFCYWLQGYFELTGADATNAPISPNQVQVIKNHLNLVFVHSIDPASAKETSTPVDVLNAVHNLEDNSLMRC